MGPGRLSWYSWQFGHHFFAGLIFRSFQIDSRKRVILWQRSVHSFQDSWGFYFTFNSDNISGNQALSASPAGIVFHIPLIVDTPCAGGCYRFYLSFKRFLDYGLLKFERRSPNKFIFKSFLSKFVACVNNVCWFSR